MRILELVLIIANAGAVLLALMIRDRRPDAMVKALACLVVLAAVLQLTVEGYRWQMVPAYLSTLMITAELFGVTAGWFWPISAGVLGGLAASTALALVYPVFRLPTPTGPYHIGTVSRELVDKERLEVLGGRPGANREVMIQLWYPTAPGSIGKVERYRDPVTTSWQTAYLTLVKTHAVCDAPVAHHGGPYPVIIFTPSWHGLRNQEMALVENLVNHGYVVIGVDHPYGSGVTVFPDGRRIYARPDRFIDTSSEETLRATTLIAEQQVRIRAADLVFVLDSLESLSRAGKLGALSEHLDFNRVGLLGYSFGGAVAAEACRMDPRFGSALDLDGALFGDAEREGIKQPFFVITDNDTPPTAAQLSSLRPTLRRWMQFITDQDHLLLKNLETHGGYAATIDGVAHSNFSDAALSSPVRWLTGAGAIKPYRAFTIIREYSLAFFDQSLKGIGQPLLMGSSARFPEVKLEIYAAPQRRHRMRGMPIERTADTPGTSRN